MKEFFFIILSFLILQLYAQKIIDTKPAMVSMHVFYTDFGTAAKIRSSSIKNVLQNKLWSGLNDMQMGLDLLIIKASQIRWIFQVPLMEVLQTICIKAV